MSEADQAHRSARKSWIVSANGPDTDFPLQNLPYGVFSIGEQAPRAGVAIGDSILDLSVLEQAGLLKPCAEKSVFDQPDINAFMALGPKVWQEIRKKIGDFLDQDEPVLRDNAPLRQKALQPMHGARMYLPLHVRSFTDFYASREHATNVGALFRDPEHALMPNWLHIPIGYNGRASSVVVSDTPVIRPLGQMKPAGSATPVFGPCAKLDIELELGAVVGTPSKMGEPVSVEQAYDMIFGYVLLNDWSARDIQTWEYQPLGPFQSKAFATSVSPWIVTREALEPFRVMTPERLQPLLPYLAESQPNNFDIALEVTLQPKDSARATIISRTNYSGMYYSSAQQLAHHAVSGCPMCTGDLLGSGTISGPAKESCGSLLEMTLNGREPLVLEGGETRTFLEDGDTVIFSGWCQARDHRIGFGQCTGTIVPAPERNGW